jgi:tetratricopeptide (TPR) repeat protein
MPELESLLRDLADRDAKRDLEGLRKIREEIVQHFPDSVAAAEANYKWGLDLLFRERSLDGAVEKFLAAAKGKNIYWALAARTSLGLCYYHQKRLQKALLELRKVAHIENPNSHSVTALSFLENIFQTEGQAQEAGRVRKERIKQLEKLVGEAAQANNSRDHGHYLYSLALALKDEGEDNRAHDLLKQAKALGKAALGSELTRLIDEAQSWR